MLMMSPTMFGSLRSKGGYTMGEVTSAMQKSIRRGLEEDALFWASELDLSGYGNYVWKRLRIIASEDVGLASSVCVQIRALYDNWVEARKEEGKKECAGKLFLVHAVLLLCRVKKSRICDHATIVYYEGERPHPPMPDYALDKHTSRGRQMGRGVSHFFDEGAKLENAAPTPDPYAERAKAARGHKHPPEKDEQMTFHHDEGE